MAEIGFHDVSKIYRGGVVALDSLNLEIADGEFMVLVGPSGCGKTTALRLLAGLEEASGGTISIGGRVANDLPAQKRDVAMVFQNYALYPHMTVGENIDVGLRVRKMPKAERRRRVAEVARLLGLDALIDRKPAALSGGQRQRAAMGRAMVREPRAFLMDEPLSNLDAKLRMDMRAELALLHERLGTTTVYVTHDQVEAMTLGQRVAVLENSVLQQVDTPKRLFAAPANVFVAGFIGSPAMNLTRAELIRDQAGPTVVVGGARLPLAADAFARRPRLERYLGREVIAGIRPSDLEDATVPGVDGRPVMRVHVDVVEELGTHINALFTPDSPRPMLGRLRADAGDTSPATRGTWVATISPSSRVAAGETLELAVDVGAMHFFDPDTGAAISAAAMTGA